MPLPKNGHERQLLSFSTLSRNSGQGPPEVEAHRRCNISALPAIGEVHAPKQTFKVQRGQPMSRKQRRQRGPDLLQKFDDALNANRDELSLWIEDYLGKTEHELNEKLEQFATSFRNNLKAIMKVDAVLRKTLANEEMTVIEKTPNAKKSQQEEDLILGDHMQEVAKILTIEKEILGRLWKRWDQTQDEIVCLAIEVSGDAILLDEEQVSEALKEELLQAARTHEEVDKQYQTAIDHVSDLEKAMKDITLEAVKTAEAQQKQWKLDHKKKLKALQDALDAFEEAG